MKPVKSIFLEFLERTIESTTLRDHQLKKGKGKGKGKGKRPMRTKKRKEEGRKEGRNKHQRQRGGFRGTIFQHFFVVLGWQHRSESEKE